jgi:hypothetical protein
MPESGSDCHFEPFLVHDGRAGQKRGLKGTAILFHPRESEKIPGRMNAKRRGAKGKWAYFTQKSMIFYALKGLGFGGLIRVNAMIIPTTASASTYGNTPI